MDLYFDAKSDTPTAFLLYSLRETTNVYSIIRILRKIESEGLESRISALLL